ncbi:energy transducer TonB [Methyloradius palustris]|uniref:TonB C-terminal domain-containing protein n=1 Tax=Methyloradius palustris TaxID=2778876 RepID=A0A8D5G1T1_9PROT|nr:energy transducer TonB [Methyloradius palustris]BCM24518.1 hypothetical protein ZMTM_07770 [Methyloradius palustris]
MLATYSPRAFNQQRQVQPERDSTLYWAVVLSVSLHIMLAFVLPRMDFKKASAEKVMTVEFMAIQPTAKETTPNPEPVAEQQPQPVPDVIKPKPLTKQPTIQKPSQEPSPSAVVEPQQSTPTTSESAKPTTQTTEDARPTTSETTVAQESKPQPAPTPPDTKDARNEYGALLTRAIEKYKQYPAIAQRRGWEGEVILELQLDGNGNMLSCRIYQSSNRESLDNQALEMVRKASPFPLPPTSLRSKTFNILVPVSFKLE